MLCILCIDNIFIHILCVRCWNLDFAPILLSDRCWKMTRDNISTKNIVAFSRGIVTSVGYFDCVFFGELFLFEIEFFSLWLISSASPYFLLHLLNFLCGFFLDCQYVKNSFLFSCCCKPNFSRLRFLSRDQKSSGVRNLTLGLCYNSSSADSSSFRYLWRGGFP